MRNCRSLLIKIIFGKRYLFLQVCRMLHNDTNFSETEIVLAPRALASLWKI